MPTVKQRLAIKYLVGNGGNVTQAMRDAGYSKGTIENPQKMLASIGFQELLDEFLPDYKLLNVHKETLEANKVISAQVFPDGKDGKPINDFIEVPDHLIRLRAVELGYKVKKKLFDHLEVNTPMLILNNGRITSRSSPRSNSTSTITS